MFWICLADGGAALEHLTIWENAIKNAAVEGGFYSRAPNIPAEEDFLPLWL